MNIESEGLLKAKAIHTLIGGSMKTLAGTEFDGPVKVKVRAIHGLVDGLFVSRVDEGCPWLLISVIFLNSGCRLPLYVDSDVSAVVFPTMDENIFHPVPVEWRREIEIAVAAYIGKM